MSQLLGLLMTLSLLLGSAVAQTNYMTLCTASGRFREHGSSCNAYYLCVRVLDEYIQKNYKCPNGTVFNATTGICSTYAICIDQACNEKDPAVSKISDPNSRNCRTYIECVGSIPVLQRCGRGFYFNKALRDPGCSPFPNC